VRNVSGMTSSITDEVVSAGSRQQDTGLLNSSNAGLIIHRSGQIRHEFRTEGRQFIAELIGHINRRLPGTATTYAYEEVLGQLDRIHCLIHLKQPNDYRALLHMADRDHRYIDITEADRLSGRGGGNWERMFTEGTFHETVYVPQHGLADDDGEQDADSFVPPAWHQTSVPPAQLVHTGNAGLVLLRTGQAKYEFRNEARFFGYDWARRVNEALPGSVSVFLYEQTFGFQDRIHWLIHFRSFDGYQQLRQLHQRDETLRELLAKPWINAAKGGGGWARTFVDGGLTDTLMVPLQSAAGF
jgi:hypothetical protein